MTITAWDEPMTLTELDLGITDADKRMEELQVSVWQADGEQPAYRWEVWRNAGMGWDYERDQPIYGDECLDAGSAVYLWEAELAAEDARAKLIREGY
jgi:hypothetical protein